jgi:predicted Zn-dependent protease with MMP-like domain
VIALYQGPLEEDFSERAELAREVEITLVHELAHFMGFDEDAVRKYGYE